MKKIIFILAFLIGGWAYGQQIVGIGTAANDGTGDPLRTAFTKINTNATAIYDSLSHIYTEAQVTAYLLKKVNVLDTATMLSKYARKLSPTFTGTVTLPAATSIGSVSATELSYVNNVTSAIQTQIGAKVDTADFHTGGSGGSITLVGNDAITLTTTGATSVTLPTSGTLLTTTGAENLQDLTDIKSDSSILITFGAGAGLTADTALFQNNVLIGAFYNTTTDTLVVTKMVSVMYSGTGTETIAVQISWDANFIDGTPTNLGGSAFVIAGAEALEGGAGEIDDTFSNTKIPPNNWVWGRLSGASKDNKPTFLNVTLVAYRIANHSH
jgi:hypothetical protein